MGEEISRNPVADLIEAGTISNEDVEAAAASKLQQLKALQNDAAWAGMKNGLTTGLVASCKKLKITAGVIQEAQAYADVEVAKRGEVKIEIPHMRVDYEKPGLYEYRTWFGKFVARKPVMGFPEEEEE